MLIHEMECIEFEDTELDADTIACLRENQIQNFKQLFDTCRNYKDLCTKIQWDSPENLQAVQNVCRDYFDYEFRRGEHVLNPFAVDHTEWLARRNEKHGLITDEDLQEMSIDELNVNSNVLTELNRNEIYNLLDLKKKCQTFDAIWGKGGLLHLPKVFGMELVEECQKYGIIFSNRKENRTDMIMVSRAKRKKHHDAVVKMLAIKRQRIKDAYTADMLLALSAPELADLFREYTLEEPEFKDNAFFEDFAKGLGVETELLDKARAYIEKKVDELSEKYTKSFLSSMRERKAYKLWEDRSNNGTLTFDVNIVEELCKRYEMYDSFMEKLDKAVSMER